MKIFTGQSIFQAVAIGRLRFCHHPPRLLSVYSGLSLEQEQARFQRAQRSAVKKLADLYARALKLVGEEKASIFVTYAMLVEDPIYQEAVFSYLQSQHATAEYAVFLAGEDLAASFSAMENDYMRARGDDMRYLSNHLIEELVGYFQPDHLEDEPTILVDDEFSPGRTLMLERGYLSGLISRRGSIHSHASELASALHIPTMVHTDLSPELDGHLAILDGFDHCLYIDPTPHIFAQMEDKLAARHYMVQSADI
jgi:phosphotransferase system enzyme I (PtsI)